MRFGSELRGSSQHLKESQEREGSFLQLKKRCLGFACSLLGSQRGDGGEFKSPQPAPALGSVLPLRQVLTVPVNISALRNWPALFLVCAGVLDGEWSLWGPVPHCLIFLPVQLSAKINQEHLITARLKPNSLPRASAQLGTTSRPLRTAFAAAPQARCPPPCPRPSSIFERPWAPHCSPVQPRCRQRAAAAQELPAGSVPRPFSTLFHCFSSAARV